MQVTIGLSKCTGLFNTWGSLKSNTIKHNRILSSSFLDSCFHSRGMGTLFHEGAYLMLLLQKMRNTSLPPSLLGEVILLERNQRVAEGLWYMWWGMGVDFPTAEVQQPPHPEPRQSGGLHESHCSSLEPPCSHSPVFSLCNCHGLKIQLAAWCSPSWTRCKFNEATMETSFT